ncbi:hypothetical protein G7048_03460 [Diaphorobacter sp. HDW4B]|uniref:hypothetical protein n=1 Tax=Diaphorobacter sp. HDW4B TaxID=2714925 RepID=UPI00140AFC14|nr:hypothetical protein [Diaphorobacter sp. HDW4B]QIL69514.1 hypothetical protein G7048_03460 [Diaphorobacter sp. HDW4B]
MTTYKLSNFVGEAPSVSDRALGSNFARRNSNLFLPSGEFWPLADDRVHSACVSGALTLHRFHRDVNGQVIQNPNAAIRSYAKEMSFVKGQINDEATERTYVTTNDGSERPRVIDSRGNDRQLGVVRPVKPKAEMQVVDEFTTEEAQTWLYGEFAEAVREDLLATVIPHEGNQAVIRWDASGKSYAGPTENYGLSLSAAVGGSAEPGSLYAVVTDARAEACAMDMTRLSAMKTASGWAIPVAAMPYSYPWRRPELIEALQLHEYPDTAGEKSGTTILTAGQADKLADLLEGATKPGTECTNWRSELDKLVKEFAGLALTKSWSTPAEPPNKPTAPEGGQWISDPGDSTGVHENPLWTQYQKDLEAYYDALDAYSTGKAEGQSQSASMNSRLVEIQQRCTSLVSSIQTQLAKQYKAATDDVKLIGQWLDKLGGVADIAGETVERVVDSRFYVVAFVTDWGEESEPSPLSDMLEVDANDTVTITRPGAMTGESHAARNVTKWRVYRSNTSSTASAWQLVQELQISVAQFLDDKASEELESLQPQFTWSAPPYRMDGQYAGDNKPTVGANPYLRGMAGMPNGIMAGFLDNTVAFCEPYVPYAWPVEYQVTTEFPVVGMACFDQTLFVGTTGNPYFITGAHSASMSALRLDSNQSCVARRSIVGVQGGVLYASPDGLCLANSGGIQVVTRQLIAREDWQKLQPSSMFGAEHEGVYYLFYAGAGGGCLAFSIQDGMKLGHIDLSGTAVWSDKFNDLMYVAHGTDIMECFTGSGRRVGAWKSSVATQGQQLPLAWAKVYGQQSAAQPVTLRLWGDGELRHIATFTNLQPQRLPPGRWLEHQVEIESAARITSIVLTSTTEELKAV